MEKARNSILDTCRAFCIGPLRLYDYAACRVSIFVKRKKVQPFLNRSTNASASQAIGKVDEFGSPGFRIFVVRAVLKTTMNEIEIKDKKKKKNFSTVTSPFLT